MERQPLWTRNFTILTLGTVVSMLGNAISGFALSLLILDYTGSTLLYAIFMVVYNLPKIIMPSIAGPYLDRFSRTKAIWTLDYLSAALYLVIFFLLRGGLFNYALLLGLCIVIGTIDSVYLVAYDSLYPMLISEGNYAKAYSISSMIYPLSALMVPVASWCYEHVGLTPLFLFNAGTFLAAAVCETRIRASETHVSTAKGSGREQLRQYGCGLREGLRFISAEKGLLLLIAFAALSELCHIVMNTVTLPWFKSPEGLGVQVHTWVGVCGVAGRLAGSAGNYLARVPKRFRALLLTALNAAVCVCFGVYLFLPLPGMLALSFLGSVAGAAAYAQSSSGVQSYVPDAVRARFNSAAAVIASLGAILGQLLGGALGDCLPMRAVAAGSMLMLLACTLLTLVAGWRRISFIFTKAGEA